MATLHHLAAMAARDYEQATGKYRPPQDESRSTLEPPERLKRLLSEWEGRPAMEVAVWERCPVKWVRRQRILNQRDPETGYHVEQPERLARAVGMVNAGKTQREIAAEIGVSHKRVGQMLDGE